MAPHLHLFTPPRVAAIVLLAIMSVANNYPFLMGDVSFDLGDAGHNNNREFGVNRNSLHHHRDLTRNKPLSEFEVIKDQQPQQQEEQKVLSESSATVLEAPIGGALSEAVKPHVGYKKVLVTGGAGFIGSHVAEFLLSRGDDVIIVDEMNDYYDVGLKESNLAMLRERYPSLHRLRIYRGDIADESFMDPIFRGEKPEWVCHMAARAGVRPSIEDPFVYLHSNIIGTTRLMDLSVKHGIVQNFVFASSSSVYGGSEETFFKEAHSVDRPVSPYAATKKSVELLAYTWHSLYNLPVSGLRFFTVYGPRGRPDMAPFKFIDNVSNGNSIQQFGDGTSSRDYTYVDDIVDGVVRSLDRPYGYQIFNLGRGDGTSLKDFIGLVEKYTTRKADIDVGPFQKGDVPYTRADVSKARRLLGYDPQVPIEEGIRRTVEWYNEWSSSSASAVLEEASLRRHTKEGTR